MSALGRSVGTGTRPWRDIQTLCQPSMATAVSRMPALKTSWPMPESAPAITSAKPATTQAPATPAAMPPATHIARRGTARVAAQAMPMMSEASRTSRKTMIALPSMAAYFATSRPCAVPGLKSPKKG